MLVDIHKSDARGNVYTLREPGGMAYTWYDPVWIGKSVYVTSGPCVEVPEGFESDGASVPRFFWRAVFPPGDTRALRAAFFHDYIYRTHPDGWTRGMADVLFLRILLVDGIPAHRAYAAYVGVRLFGWIAWRKGGAA